MKTGSRTTELCAGLITTGIVFGLLSLWVSAPEGAELVHAAGTVDKVLSKKSDGGAYIWLREESGHVVVLNVHSVSYRHDEAVSSIAPGDEIGALYSDAFSSRHGSFEAWSIYDGQRAILSIQDKVRQSTRTANVLQIAALSCIVLGVVGLAGRRVANTR